MEEKVSSCCVKFSALSIKDNWIQSELNVRHAAEMATAKKKHQNNLDLSVSGGRLVIRWSGRADWEEAQERASLSNTFDGITSELGIGHNFLLLGPHNLCEVEVEVLFSLVQNIFIIYSNSVSKISAIKGVVVIFWTHLHWNNLLTTKMTIYVHFWIPIVILG